jgi:hypothetical protein
MPGGMQHVWACNRSTGHVEFVRLQGPRGLHSLSSHHAARFARGACDFRGGVGPARASLPSVSLPSNEPPFTWQTCRPPMLPSTMYTFQLITDICV